MLGPLLVALLTSEGAPDGDVKGRLHEVVNRLGVKGLGVKGDKTVSGLRARLEHAIGSLTWRQTGLLLMVTHRMHRMKSRDWRADGEEIEAVRNMMRLVDGGLNPEPLCGVRTPGGGYVAHRGGHPPDSRPVIVSPEQRLQWSLPDKELRSPLEPFVLWLAHCVRGIKPAADAPILAISIYFGRPEQQRFVDKLEAHRVELGFLDLVAQDGSHVVDWLLEEAPADLMALSFEDAIDRSRQAHGLIAECHGYREPAPRALTVAVWPDGARLDRLVTNGHFMDESTSLGHCIGGLLDPRTRRPSGNSHYYQRSRKGNGLAYSYRDPDGVPQATVWLEPDMRGVVNRGNEICDDPDRRGWHVGDIQGPDNSSVTDPLARFRLVVALEYLATDFWKSFAAGRMWDRQLDGGCAVPEPQVVTRLKDLQDTITTLETDLARLRRRGAVIGFDRQSRYWMEKAMEMQSVMVIVLLALYPDRHAHVPAFTEPLSSTSHHVLIPIWPLYTAGAQPTHLACLGVDWSPASLEPVWTYIVTDQITSEEIEAHAERRPLDLLKAMGVPMSRSEVRSKVYSCCEGVLTPSFTLDGGSSLLSPDFDLFKEAHRHRFRELVRMPAPQLLAELGLEVNRGRLVNLQAP